MLRAIYSYLLLIILAFDINGRPNEEEILYFVLPDRFSNGNIHNDRGFYSGTIKDHGFDPTNKGYYHGGDIEGLLNKLPYIKKLGVTAIWLAPIYKNKVLQGPPHDDSTGYHGYWTTDFYQVDPHFGTNEEFKSVVDKLGHTPIPKYLEREATPEDEEMYQTIFAEEEGAIAPPAAGLHFTKALMMRLEIKGIEFAKVNLNIGLGSFRPVEVEDLTKHKMDSEHFRIDQEAADIVNNAKENKKRVLAVGSSVMRAMESSVSAFGMLNPDDNWTDKFIFPPYEPRIANCYLTNFHQPQSTLMMLTSAYLDDHKLAMEVYETALKKGYNFLCYGDALLIK